MRRKEKHVFTGALIGGAVMSLTDVLEQWIEHQQADEDFSWENFDGQRTYRKACTGGLIGGTLGYTVYRYKLYEESKLPFNSDTYLKKILSEENMKSDCNFHSKVLQLKKYLKACLFNEFSKLLVSAPEFVGSFQKRTAIASEFDLDVILPFKKNSFNSLETMYDVVYKAIGDKFGDKATITKQTRTIGISFGTGDKFIHIDVAPGKEINDYKKDKDLNLFIRPDWAWQSGSRFKVNTHLQKSITVNNPKARAVIKLLKRYRNANSLRFPSTLINRFVVDALSISRCGIASSDTKNLLNTMNYISNRIHYQTLTDIANSNNNLLDKMHFSDREKLSRMLQKDIAKISLNARYIKEIF